jgi:hypothetical protein
MAKVDKDRISFETVKAKTIEETLRARSADYKKVLVVWDVEDESVIEQAKRSPFNIEIWKISDIMSELIKEVGTKSYRDDVLRTIQLISKKANVVV